MNNTGIRPNGESLLADFTDRVMSTGQEGQPHDLPNDDHHDEEIALQSMVIRILNAFPTKTPGKEFQDHMRNVILQEYRHTMAGGRVENDRQRRRILGYALAFCAVTTLIATFVFLPGSIAITPGAAENMPLWIPAIVIVGIIAGLISWRIRKK